MILKVVSNIGRVKLFLDDEIQQNLTVLGIQEKVLQEIKRQTNEVYRLTQDLSLDTKGTQRLDPTKSLHEQEKLEIRQPKSSLLLYCRVEPKYAKKASIVPTRKRQRASTAILDLIEKDSDNHREQRTTTQHRTTSRTNATASSPTKKTKPTKLIPPPKPLPDDHANSFWSRLAKTSAAGTNCVLYLCCTESEPSAFSKGLDKCARSMGTEHHTQLHSASVHNHCFQRDGTRHVSLWQGKLTLPKAKELVQKCKGNNTTDDEPSLPLQTIHFAKGWNSWKAGNYIGVVESDTKILQDWKKEVLGLEGKGGDHLSLYRKRGQNDNITKKALAKVRNDLQDYEWGSLPVHSIRLKILGGEYNECKELIVAAKAASPAVAAAVSNSKNSTSPDKMSTEVAKETEWQAPWKYQYHDPEARLANNKKDKFAKKIVYTIRDETGRTGRVTEANMSMITKRQKIVVDRFVTNPKDINWNNESITSIGADSHVSLGKFQDGNRIYRNALENRNEQFQDGHLTMSNLIPTDCTEAFITSFEKPGSSWVQSLFEEFGPSFRLAIACHDPDHLRGAAVATPIVCDDDESRNSNQNWKLYGCSPHTGGNMHAKLLLFRTPKGLRIVVSGNNFCQYQCENDRDCLWVQDFWRGGGHATMAAGNPSKQSEFERDLRAFVTGLCCGCKNAPSDQQWIRSLLHDILVDIDFSTCQASLVTSFPRTKEELTVLESANLVALESFNHNHIHGGWKQLARIVQHRIQCDYDTENSQDEFRNNASNHPSVLFAMSGSMGDLDAQFLHNLRGAMVGDEDNSDKWETLRNTKVLMPSQQTAKTMVPIWNGRMMNYNHWTSAIPDQAKRKFFDDAIPNPNYYVTSNCQEKNPFSHAKVLYLRPSRSTPSDCRAFVYVGSHNVSKTAWGKGGQMPKSIELGVLLSTTNKDLQSEWESRLPHELPSSNESSSNYAPGRGPSMMESLQHLGEQVNSGALSDKPTHPTPPSRDDSNENKLFPGKGQALGGA